MRHARAMRGVWCVYDIVLGGGSFKANNEIANKKNLISGLLVTLKLLDLILYIRTLHTKKI